MWSWRRHNWQWFVCSTCMRYKQVVFQNTCLEQGETNSILHSMSIRTWIWITIQATPSSGNVPFKKSKRTEEEDVHTCWWEPHNLIVFFSIFPLKGPAHLSSENLIRRCRLRLIWEQSKFAFVLSSGLLPHACCDFHAVVSLGNWWSLHEWREPQTFKSS